MEYNFTEADLFIQTLYFIWLKENRKVIDIDDIASYNAIIKDMFEKKGIKLSYYKLTDDDRKVEDYFKRSSHKYMLFPWLNIIDIEYEIPDAILNNEEEITNKLPPKDKFMLEEYKEMYESFEDDINSRDYPFGKKR